MVKQGWWGLVNREVGVVEKSGKKIAKKAKKVY